MEAPLTNSAKETEVSKSIDTDKPVQEVENVERTETTIDKEHTEEEGNISVSDKEAGNNGVSENEEPWLMVPQSSPSGSRKLEKPETSKVPEDQSKTSPSHFHLLRKELEEGEMEDEDESESSEGESSVEIRETLEKRKQLEKEKYDQTYPFRTQPTSVPTILLVSSSSTNVAVFFKVSLRQRRATEIER
ncbi:hypothetical protein F2Q70_00023998 [Brassica cretica]|uniref:Uncharacterized protein n=1 Tax=Brassica cretica TaxID=69181 RepID=A0A8S9GLU5_BRACR|nr:hypothetical protein F2Q70_00023998 [Brassica cretica]